MGDVELAAELTKIGFALENLYALVLADRGTAPEDVDRIADELIRQFTQLPASGRSIESEAMETLRDLAAMRLEVFFANVKVRMTPAAG